MTRAARHPNHRSRDALPTELRRVTVSPAARAWVASATGLTVVRLQRLPGASTSAVHRLTLSNGTSVVLRRYLWPDALGLATRHRLAVPTVLASDVTGAGVGDGVPTLLTTFLPGRAVAVPDAHRLAEVAATIHDVDPAGFGHHYFPWCRETTTGPPPGATRPRLWAAAIDRWLHDMPAYHPTFVHRDFHPGNVLWSRGRATGIVDWAEACRGPWGCDVAHCRADLIRLAGPDAADRFLAAYCALTGRTFDPYWEVASVLEHGPSYWNAASVTRAEARLALAMR